MRIPSGVSDQFIYFVAVDSTDFSTRETGLTGFTVYRSRNGAAAAAMTTPTINETDSTNMPGVYELLLDEDMAIGAGNDTEEMVFHITATGMAPVTRTIELFRPKITAGNTLGVAADGDLLEVNTLTGHTAQTGDSFARLGAPAGASVSADIAVVDSVVDGIQTDLDNGTDGLGAIKADTAAILTDTAEIGVAGAGLTAVPWNSSWDAEVESEVNDALVGIHLDHLLAVDYDPASKPGVGTALLNELIENDAGVSRFTANALEQGPAGGGGGTATLTNQNTIIGHLTDIKGVGWDSTNSLEAIHDDLAVVDGVVDSVLVDTDATIPAQISALNNISAAEVNAEVDTALNDYDGPTNTEMLASFAAIDALIDQILADTGTDGVVLSAATCNQIADHLLRRAFASARTSSDGDAVQFRSLLGAVAKLVNRVAASGNTLSIYQEDDSTALGTQALTLDANATPITEVDTN